MQKFRSVGIIGRKLDQLVVKSLSRLITFLQQRNVEVVLEAETASLIPGYKAKAAPLEQIGLNCELVIVIGGDGSMLTAGRAMARFEIPLLGINRGRLGFLNDITPESIEKLVGEVLNGEYLLESRFLLEMKVTRGNALIGAGTAVNDVVLNPGQFIRMIEFELYIDGQFVYSQRSDGLIVSTPTGSTAYALSGGGPIMHPALDAIVLVPMNPHTLSSRPIVVSGNSEIKLVVGKHNTVNPHITCDGHNSIPTVPGDEVVIRKNTERMKLIHPKKHNFYHTCRTKLGWGSHLID